MSEGIKVIGNTTNVLDSYYYGRVCNISGYISVNSKVKLNHKKFYGIS